jgi:hypothetical protein
MLLKLGHEENSTGFSAEKKLEVRKSQANSSTAKDAKDAKKKPKSQSLRVGRQ